MGDDAVYVGVTETARIVTVPISADGSAGEASVSAQLEAAIDGIALDDDGDIYIAHPIDNVVSRVSADGSVDVVADVDDGLDAPASVVLGVDANGEKILYVSNFSIALGGPLGAGPSVVAITVDQAD